MAAELGTVTCVQHGEQEIVERDEVDCVRMIKLACNCALTFDLVQVGDAVTFEGELFRVVWVGPGPAFDELQLRNNQTSFYTESYSVQYVARDTLSSPLAYDRQPSFDMFYQPPRGPSRYFPGNEGPPQRKFTPNETSTRRTKPMSLSRGDIIDNEVKKLEQKQETQEKDPTDDTGPIPRREGDWG